MNHLTRLSSLVALCTSLIFTAPSHATDPLAVGLDNLEPGHWYEYTNSRLESVQPCPGAANCDNSLQHNVAGIMNAWGGAAFDPVSNRLFVWGGGHNDYSGNELYAFSVESGTWERLTDPSRAPFADGDGAYYPDGLPQSRHTYNHLQFDPVRNEFLSLAAAATFGPASTSHRNVDAFNLDSMTWVRKASSPNNDGIIAGGASAYDSRNDVFWLYDRSDRVKRFNPATNTWAEFGFLVAEIYTTADVDIDRNLLVYTGNGDLRYMDLRQSFTEFGHHRDRQFANGGRAGRAGFRVRPDTAVVCWLGRFR